MPGANGSKVSIEIHFKVFPQIYVFEDEKGKRAIYTQKINNIICNNPDFKLESFKIKLNYNSKQKF